MVNERNVVPSLHTNARRKVVGVCVAVVSNEAMERLLTIAIKNTTKNHLLSLFSFLSVLLKATSQDHFKVHINVLPKTIICNGIKITGCSRNVNE